MRLLFNQSDYEILDEIKEVVKKWPPQRKIVSEKFYANRLRRGLPVKNYVTYESIKEKMEIKKRLERQKEIPRTGKE